MKFTLGPVDLSTELNFTIPLCTEEGNIVNRVGIYSSGGLDSGAMLCLVLAELQQTGRLGTIPVFAFTVVKGEGSTYYSQRVIENISRHFNVPITHVNNIVNDDSAFGAGRVGLTPMTAIWEENHHDMAIYMSINKMAPNNIRPFAYTLKAQYKDVNKHRIAPFLNMHKPQILDLYYKLGCEEIIKYTHSCTSQAVDRCNACYSCAERDWGFSALLKTDPGTIPPNVPNISYGGTWVYSV